MVDDFSIFQSTNKGMLFCSDCENTSIKHLHNMDGKVELFVVSVYNGFRQPFQIYIYFYARRNNNTIDSIFKLNWNKNIFWCLHSWLFICIYSSESSFSFLLQEHL